MLRSLKEITGYTLLATDDVIGHCKDFLFDDGLWVVRYMVADTGKWLTHHEVLITPSSLKEPDWSTEQISVNLTHDQIEASPPLEKHAPVSREYEIAFHEYYDQAFYWLGADLREGRPDEQGVIQPIEDLPDIEELSDEDEVVTAAKSEDTQDLEGKLRSAVEVMDYMVESKDGDAGRVEDLIVDDLSWVIRYLVVDTGHWLPGKKVLVNPEWIESVTWADQKVHVDLDQQEIEKCPDYDADAPVNREYEVRLYDYHGRPRYWERKE
ncbi:MAG: PRC-barrel domain containing protein [Gammaproteobacteria bacterium]|nr:MAG: PRC-barrel domain containing protein [Gammaproteobacteria bacterium]